MTCARAPADALTLPQRAALLTAIRPFADGVERVDLYGSRARLAHRPGSDIDLAVAGPIAGRDWLLLLSAIEESDVSVFVDAHHYRDIAESSLGPVVAHDARLLFDRDDLLRREG